MNKIQITRRHFLYGAAAVAGSAALAACSSGDGGDDTPSTGPSGGGSDGVGSVSIQPHLQGEV